MQAIILAAGMGRRLGTYTKNNTKCMVSVNGVRLIDRMLSQLSALNLNRIVIVIGYKGKELADYIKDNYRGKIRIELVENPIYDKTNNIYSLFLAKDKLAEDDTLLLESDLIFEKQMLDIIINHSDKNLALVSKYESWMDGTMVRIDEDRNIVNFVPKEAFRYEDVDVYYKTVNIYKFSKEFLKDTYIPFLEAYTKVMGRNEYYEQVLRVISLLHTGELKALPTKDEKWYEIDDVQDLDIASTLFATGEDKYNEYHKRYGGYWRFPELLDFCYLVNPFFPPKRMREELKANFDTLLTDYPSGMFINSLLAGKYFGVKQDYIVVGNGAAELIKVVMEEHSANKVGIIFPTFDEYLNRLKEERIVAFISQNKNFSYTADDLISFYKDKNIGLLLLINPDNPSGNFIPKADVLRLASWCKENNIVLIVDESFVDFTEDFENNSLLNDVILESFPTMLVMKSISKSYGVPGLRLGILASANTDIIAKIKKDVSIWNINSFAEFYMQIFGKYEKDYKKACVEFIKEREVFKQELEQVSYLRVIPSQANYFMCEITDKYTSAQLKKILVEHDILISDCGRKRNMGNKNFIRLAVRDRKDNHKLVEVLKSL